MVGEWIVSGAAVWWDWILACLPGALGLYLIVELVIRYGKNIPARARYCMLLLVLLKCVIPCPWTLQAPLPALEAPAPILMDWDSLSSKPTVPIVSANVSTPIDVEPISKEVERVTSLLPAFSILFLLSLCGTILAAAAIIAKMIRSRMLIPLPREDEIAVECARICECLRMKIPRMLVSQTGQGPYAGGLFSPCLIVPAHWLGRPVAQRRPALAHELAHIRRGDYFVNWLQVTVTAFCWWNPLIARLNYLIRLERELCCDEFVLRTLDIEPIAYSRLLLDAAEEQVRFRHFSWTPAFADSTHSINQRIRRILMLKKVRPRFSWIGLFIVLAFGFSLFFGFQIAAAVSDQSKRDLAYLRIELAQLQSILKIAYENDLEIPSEEISALREELGKLKKTVEIEGYRNPKNPLHHPFDKPYETIRDITAHFYESILDAKLRGDQEKLNESKKKLKAFYDELEQQKSIGLSIYEEDKKEENYERRALEYGTSLVYRGQRSMQNALESFFIDHNTYPVPIEGYRLDQMGLIARMETDEKGNMKITPIEEKRPVGSPLKEGESIIRLTTPIAYLVGFPKDPFDVDGKTYRYFSDGPSFYILSSKGPDGDIDFNVSDYKGEPKSDIINKYQYQYDFKTGKYSSGDIIRIGP